MNSRRKIIKTLAYLGGVIQVIGGILTIYFVYKSATENIYYDLKNSLLITIPQVLLSITAGILIFRSNSSYGTIPSLINYFFQVFQLQFKGLYYFYIMGPLLGLGIVKNAESKISFWWETSKFAGYIIIKQVEDKTGFFLTINIVALLFFIVYYLENKYRKTLKSSTFQTKINQQNET